VKVLAAIAALPAAAAAIWLLLHTPLAARLGAAPREDRWHERTTPVLGGIGIFAGILTGFWVAVAVGAAPASRELEAILGGCAILFVAGLLDASTKNYARSSVRRFHAHFTGDMGCRP